MRLVGRSRGAWGGWRDGRRLGRYAAPVVPPVGRSRDDSHGGQSPTVQRAVDDRNQSDREQSVSEYSAADSMAITAATYASAGAVTCGYCPAAAEAASV